MSRKDYSRQNAQSRLHVEMADSRKADKTSHDIGWPHFDRKGNCLCKCRYCLSAKTGCICRGCKHRSHPIGH